MLAQLLAWILVSLPADGVTIVVSPAGDDAGPGTAAAPVATLERARDLAREHPARPVTISLRAGVHRLARTLVLDPRDAGSATAPRVWLGEPGAVISGGRPITGWSRGDDGVWTARVPWLAQRREPLCQLFVNGQRRPRARTPNAGTYAYTRRLLQTADETPLTTGMIVDPADVTPWDAPDDRVVCLFHNWVNSYNRVSEADWDRHRLTFARPAGIFFLGPSVRYYVEGAREYLDAPGEWSADAAAGTLSYRPVAGEDPNTAEIIAPFVPRTLIRFQGDPGLSLWVEHVELRGLVFEHSEADLSADYEHSVQGAHLQRGAIDAVGLRHGVIEGCEFRHLGEHAVSLREYCQDNTVRQCHAWDLGGGGIYLSVGVPADTSDAYLTARNTVANNLIHDGGHLFRAGCGVFLGGSASYNTIAHNEICDLSWVGIHAGWSWTGRQPASTHHNDIGWNHLHHLGGGVLCDLAGIYTLGVSPGTVLHHNLIHDVRRFERGREGYGGWGIYLDAGSSDIVVERNIVHDTHDGGLHLHNYSGPHGNLIRGNIFAFATHGQWMRNADLEPLGVHARLEHNIVTNNTPVLLYGSNWAAESNVESDGNLFWSDAGEPDFAGRTFAEWQAEGRDGTSRVADPRFVDAAGRDFRLREDSPAPALGFEPLDLRAAGLEGPPEWRALAAGLVHRAVETAVAVPVPLSEDFEAYTPGETPAGAVAAEGDAQAVVTDANPYAGEQCLMLVDTPGVTIWKPHWYAFREPGRGPVVVRCALRLDDERPAAVDLELRDWPATGGRYETGPLLRLNPDGAVLAADGPALRPLTTIAPGTWIRVEIRLTEGPDRAPTYSVALTADGRTTTWRDLRFRSDAFRSATWLGLAGIGELPGRFFADDIAVER